jgi:hypothetical protein
MLKKFGAFSLLLCLLALSVHAAPPPNLPPETRNAALRYWMAFAEIQDPPADKETSDLLEKTAAGEAPWDEAKLGPILDKNETAIQIMQRATKLPDCDWGLEYSRGPAASIAYAPRARVLARLNTLYGMRLASKGDTQAAVDTWLAGIHFSQDLAKGGTLIFTLVAKTALLSSLNALTHAAEKGTLSTADKAKVSAAVGTLPETGFDWSRALFLEQSGIEIGIQEIKESADPAHYYQQLMGHPAPVNPATLSAPDAAAFAKVMSGVEQAMRLPPDQADARLKALQPALDALNPIYLQMIPSLTKVNLSRKEVAGQRSRLLSLLTGN